MSDFIVIGQWCIAISAPFFIYSINKIFNEKRVVRLEKND